jgi:hypothetical protein
MTENLIRLVTLDIPKPVKKEIGFLELIRKAHDENINSRIYAYFLNQIENPKISDLFKDALLSVIQKKFSKEFFIGDFTPELEVVTDLGRIDIVLMQTDFKKVILIENKIYHHLSNPLDDYWNHYNHISDEDKLGILLSLHPTDVEKEMGDKFLNITHFDWITEIVNTGMPHDIDAKTYIYLKDFLSTMLNFYNTKGMNEQAKFYFDHAQKIQDAIKTSDSALNYLLDEINEVANKLELQVFNASKYSRNIWDERNNRKTYYTVAFRGLMEGNEENYIILEMMTLHKDMVPEIREHFKNDPDFNNPKVSYDSGFKDKNLLHFAFVKLNLNAENLGNIGDYIMKEITENFQPMYIKILQYIDSKE